jgi:hypothetical protein
MGRSKFNANTAESLTIATWKAKCEGMHLALLAAGLVRGSDTGQIVFSNFASLPAANTLCGFAIYLFPDALQSTSPIFIRAEYWTNPNSRPEVRFSVGKGSNGTGALTSTIADVVGFPSRATTTNITGQAGENYVSFAEGSLCILSDIGTPTNSSAQSPTYFSLERTRNSSGASTGDGFLFALSCAPLTTAPTTPTIRTIKCFRYSDLAFFTLTNILQVPGDMYTTSMGVGATPMLLIPYVLFPGGAPWQPLSICAIPPLDRPTVEWTATLYGKSLTYIAPENTSSSGTTLPRSHLDANAYNATAILWVP